MTEFFAKKKEKSKEKKKKGVNIEDVGMQLERKARRQVRVALICQGNTESKG